LLQHNYQVVVWWVDVERKSFRDGLSVVRVFSLFVTFDFDFGITTNFGVTNCTSSIPDSRQNDTTRLNGDLKIAKWLFSEIRITRTAMLQITNNISSQSPYFSKHLYVYWELLIKHEITFEFSKENIFSPKLVLLFAAAVAVGAGAVQSTVMAHCSLLYWDQEKVCTSADADQQNLTLLNLVAVADALAVGFVVAVVVVVAVNMLVSLLWWMSDMGNVLERSCYCCCCLLVGGRGCCWKTP